MDSIIAPDNSVNISTPKLPSLSKTPSLSKVTSEWPSSPVNSPNVGMDVWTIMKFLAIIIIIAALGFNVFSYLSQGTDYLSGMVKSIASYLPTGLSKTLNLSVAGTKLGTDIAAGTIKDVGKIVTEVPKAGLPSLKSNAETTKTKTSNKVNNKPLSDAVDKGKDVKTNNPAQDKSSSSSIQNQHGKSWCYVGTDRTYRSCVEVDSKSDCVSGKVFPSKMVCINPGLRQ